MLPTCVLDPDLPSCHVLTLHTTAHCLVAVVWQMFVLLMMSGHMWLQIRGAPYMVPDNKGGMVSISTLGCENDSWHSLWIQGVHRASPSHISSAHRPTDPQTHSKPHKGE